MTDALTRPADRLADIAPSPIRAIFDRADRRDTRYRPDGEIIVTVGANEAVFLAVMAFRGPGDEVVVPVPAWAHYRACIRLAGATPVEVGLDPANGYRLDRRALAGAITDRTRMVVLCTPNNPTGTVADESDLRAVAEMLRPTNALLLSDEIYADLTYGVPHVSPGSPAELYPRTLTVGGFAKAFAMDGWRLGWLAGPAELISPALRVRQYTTVCPTTFTQDGAVAALRSAGDEAGAVRRAFARRRGAALRELGRTDKIDVAPPDGAFYLYLSYHPDTAEPAAELAGRLLEERRCPAPRSTRAGARTRRGCPTPARSRTSPKACAASSTSSRRAP